MLVRREREREREGRRNYLKVVEFDYKNVTEFIGLPVPGQVTHPEVLEGRRVSRRTAGPGCWNTNLALLCRLRVDGPDTARTDTRHAEEQSEAAFHDSDIPTRGSGVLPGFFKDQLELSKAHGNDWLLLSSEVVIDDD